jgi:hypothetical protein
VQYVCGELRDEPVEGGRVERVQLVLLVSPHIQALKGKGVADLATRIWTERS